MFFVDESIQHDLGYICLGLVYCEQAPDEAINSALLQAGLTPTLNEYKSGARMVKADRLHDLISTTDGIPEATAANATTAAPVAFSTFAGKTEEASIDICLTPIEDPQNEDQDEDEEPTDKPFVMGFDPLKVTASNTANVNVNVELR